MRRHRQDHAEGGRRWEPGIGGEKDKGSQYRFPMPLSPSPVPPSRSNRARIRGAHRGTRADARARAARACLCTRACAGEGGKDGAEIVAQQWWCCNCVVATVARQWHAAMAARKRWRGNGGSAMVAQPLVRRGGLARAVKVNDSWVLLRRAQGYAR
jgi:hypothetical protein